MKIVQKVPICPSPVSPIVNIFDYHGAFEQLISVPDY